MDAGAGASAGAGDASAVLATVGGELSGGPSAAAVAASSGVAAGSSSTGGGSVAGDVAESGVVSAAGAGAGVTGGGAGAGEAVTGGGSAGRSESGSTYPCAFAVTRTPMYTYGTSSSGVPLGPTVPTASPSTTCAPPETAIEPRCVSVTEYPSGVAIVTDFPLVGTVPAKLTVPDAGAPTEVPAAAPTSMPRC